MYRTNIQVQSSGQGMLEITALIQQAVSQSGVQSGLCQIFLMHTSASLVISENADPSAQQDMEDYFQRIAPENDPRYTHTAEGPDDMPSHLKMALTRTSESIFVDNGKLVLGTWQGIFLFEHRHRPHTRTIEIGIL